MSGEKSTTKFFIAKGGGGDPREKSLPKRLQNEWERERHGR